MALRPRRPIHGTPIAVGNNTLQVTPDRTEMTIISPSGQRATFKSARTAGFTDSDLDHARRLRLRTQDGQTNRTWRIPLRRPNLFLHCNTGPPLWVLPHISVRRTGVSAGWLYVLVAITVDPPTRRGTDRRRRHG